MLDFLCRGLTSTDAYYAHILPSLLVLFTIQVLYGVAACHLGSQEPGYGFAFWYLLGPLCLLPLCYFHPGNPVVDGTGSCLVLYFHCVFYY